MHRLKHSKSNRGGLRQRLSLLKHANYIGGASAVALGLLALALISPSVTEGVSAEELTATSSTTYSAVVNPVLSIALDSAVKVEFTPTSSGDYKNSVANLSVATNNTAGYRIMLATNSDNNALENTNGVGIIPSITTATAVDNLPKDTWGYSLVKAGENLSTYYTIPNTNTEARKVDTGDVTAGLTDNYTLNFGTKVTNSLPAGIYNKEFVVSVVANPAELRSLTDITIMQDMNSKICTNTPVGTETQLQDSRDNKWYWVSKLKDGNCWMTQNLAYDITQERIDNNEINSNNTDVAETWNMTSVYPPKATITTTNFDVGTDVTSTNSWNLGEWILKNPTSSSLCADIPTGGTLTNCNRLDAWSSPQDTHYLIGNYYQWNAATAGSGVNVTEDLNALHSVCPKNWQLPISGVNASESKTFYALLSQYEVENVINAGEYDIASKPLFFVRSGTIVPANKALRFAGYDGDYWSSTAIANNTNAYLLYFNNTTVRPWNGYNQSYGQPIRCLAR